MRPADGDVLGEILPPGPQGATRVAGPTASAGSAAETERDILAAGFRELPRRNHQGTLRSAGRA